MIGLQSAVDGGIEALQDEAASLRGKIISLRTELAAAQHLYQQAHDDKIRHRDERDALDREVVRLREEVKRLGSDLPNG